jgi:O-Antigen ligase
VWTLALMGLCLLLAPPRAALPFWPKVALLGLSAAGLLTLMPLSWLGQTAGELWRQKWQEIWQLPVGNQITVLPAATLESWGFLTVALLWWVACVGQVFNESNRRLAISLIVIGGAALAGLSLLEYWHVCKVPWWPMAQEAQWNQYDFGPFYNRNHASSYVAMLAVLALAVGVDQWKRGSRLSWLFFATIPLCLSLILINTSRAGLLLLIIGLAGWVALATVRQSVMQKAVVGLALGILLVSMAVVSDGRLGEKLRQNAATGSTVITQNDRVNLATEVLHTSTERPWLGRGLGTFEYTFPFVSKQRQPELVKILHPESDVLWLLYEGGILMLLPAGALVAWLLNASGPWRRQRQRQSQETRSMRRLRCGAAMACVLALIHAVVDVPLHGLGYFITFSLCAGLAIHRRALLTDLSRLGQGAYRAAGLLLLTGSAYWFGVVHRGTDSGLVTTAYENYYRALNLSLAGQVSEARPQLERAIQILPLESCFYFLRAQLNLYEKGNRNAALMDFGRSRALEPYYTPQRQDEATYWLSYEPKYALIAWREMLRLSAHNVGTELNTFHFIMHQSRPYPQLQPGLWALCRNATLKLKFLSEYGLPREVLQTYLNEFINDYPALQSLQNAQMRLVFKIWYQNADRAAMMSYLKKNPGLQSHAWVWLSYESAERGQYDDACRMAIKNLPHTVIPANSTPRDIPRLERTCILQPLDPLCHTELYHAYRQAENLKAAKRVLDKLLQLRDPPAHLNMEKAELLVAMQEPREAWEILRGVIDQKAEKALAYDPTL